MRYCILLPLCHISQVQNKQLKRIVAWVLGFLLAGVGVAQPTGNPFELEYRIQQDSLLGSTEASSITPGNPFELLVRPEISRIEAPMSSRFILHSRTKQLNPTVQLAQIKMTATIVILLLLTFLVTLFRALLAKSYAGFVNDNLLFQFYREQEGRGLTAIWLLFLLLPVNLGFTLFFGLHSFSISFFSSLWVQLGVSMAVVFGAYMLKFVVLRSISSLFGLERDISRYVFLILVFGVVLGVFLAPINIVLAYGPTEMQKGLISTAGVLIIIIYSFRALRGILIGNKFFVSHKFHFLLYICAVEILPLLLFYKVLKG